jgi:hypothetical protein
VTALGFEVGSTQKVQRDMAKQALRIWPKPKGIFWFQLRIHLPPYNLIPGLKYLKINKKRTN